MLEVPSSYPEKKDLPKDVDLIVKYVEPPGSRAKTKPVHVHCQHSESHTSTLTTEASDARDSL